jgi:hypothetical protein
MQTTALISGRARWIMVFMNYLYIVFLERMSCSGLIPIRFRATDIMGASTQWSWIMVGIMGVARILKGVGQFQGFFPKWGSFAYPLATRGPYLTILIRLLTIDWILVRYRTRHKNGTFSTKTALSAGGGGRAPPTDPPMVSTAGELIFSLVSRLIAVRLTWNQVHMTLRAQPPSPLDIILFSPFSSATIMLYTLINKSSSGFFHQHI